MVVAKSPMRDQASLNCTTYHWLYKFRDISMFFKLRDIFFELSICHNFFTLRDINYIVLIVAKLPVHNKASLNYVTLRDIFSE